LGSLDYLDDWNPKELDGHESISYQTLDGVTLFNAFNFKLEEGKYKVEVKGYKRKQKDNNSANFGFQFTFSETQNFDSFLDPLSLNLNIAKS
jgi:hypothetical protein